ncbi:MAG: TAXI family TRAP transporter solute-binding subunit [Burkholderiales bacterium]|nr:TAXI family TRAP transporter solute-binding subunit [Burkholderiales bacterium]
MKQRPILAVVAAVILAAGTSAPAFAADPDNVNLITGPFGTGSYVLGNALEQISKETSSTVRVNSTETPGLVFNAKKLDTDPALKKNTIMAFTTGIDYLAVNGIKPFTKKYPGAQLIANYNLGSVWLATFDPKIKSGQDLVGKKIALGRAPQILWTIEPDFIIRYGWGLQDKINIERLGTKEAAQALLDGNVDAAIVGGYVDPISGTFAPSPQTVTLLGSGKRLYYIPWGQEAVAKTIAKGVAIKPLTLPAGALAGMDAPLPTFVDAIAWVAYPELDQNIAYEVTKMIISNVTKFRDYHALGKLMNAKSILYGWDPKDIAPGALKAYREAGLIK